MRQAKRTNTKDPAPSERICWRYQSYDEATVAERLAWDMFWREITMQAYRLADSGRTKKTNEAPEVLPPGASSRHDREPTGTVTSSATNKQGIHDDTTRQP